MLSVSFSVVRIKEGLGTILGAESTKHIESLGALLSFQEQQGKK